MKIKNWKLLKPTPAKWRKIGNVLLAVSLAAAAFEVTYEHPYLGHIAVGAGILAKIIIAALTADEKEN